MTRLAGLRTVLSGRDFRRLYATRLVAQSGDGLFQVSLAAYAFFDPQSRPTAAAVALAFAALLLPYSLVGPWAGVFLDRWRRRSILVGAGVVRLGLVLAAAAVVLAHGPLWALLALGLCVVSVNRFFLAALSASLPRVVPRAELVTANSLSTTSGTIAAFVGGGVGYGLRLALGDSAPGTGLLLAATGLWYLGSGLVARRMARDLLGPDDDPGRPPAREALRVVADGLLAGARHVAARRQAAAALSAVVAHRFLYGITTVAVLLLYRNYFHPTELALGLGGLALALGATGAGYFAAALLTPVVTRRVAKPTWAAGLLVAATALQLGFGLPYREPLLVVGSFLLGIVAQGLKISVDTIVQESVDDAYRGRVFAFYDVLFNVAFVAAAAAAALVLPETGKSYAVTAAVAVGYLLTGVLYARVARRGQDTGVRPPGRGAPARSASGPAAG